MKKNTKIALKRILAVTLSLAMTMSGNCVVKADSNISELFDEEVSEDITALEENEDASVLEENEDIIALEANEESSGANENPSGLSDEDEEARNNDMNPGLYGTPKIKTYLNAEYEGWESEKGTYDRVVIKKDDNNSEITENMVNFDLLGTLKTTTLVIDGVDEIRKICFPQNMKNLIIKNTTLNLRDDCGFFNNYGGFKNANLETLILENVTIGNRFEYDFSGSEDIYSRWSYLKNNRIDISSCKDLKELKLDVNFLSDQSVLVFDAGSEYTFDGLKASKKCTINNNSSIGRVFVVSKNPDSFFCKNGYSTADAVEFEDQYFEKFLFNQGIDTNNDGVLTQGELEKVKDLTCNINTIGSVLIDIIQSYKDIETLTNLENITIELGRNRNAARINEIAFPDSGHLKNITIMNTHTTISSMTVPSVENFTYTNNYGIEINQSVTKPELVINDTLGKLTTLNISYSDVTGVMITNNANKRNLSIRASHCEDLGKIEFLGNGYTLFGDVDIDYCYGLQGIGTKTTTDGVTKWQVDGAFDGNVTYINADYCKRLCGDELIINYDFAEGRTLNINAYELGASNEKNKLTILGRTAGNVKFFCGESDSWIKAQFNGQDGFTVKTESSTPNILEFPFGNHIRDNAGNGSNTPEQWVDRYDIVLRSGSYGPHMDTAKQDTINNFVQNIKFYVSEGGSRRRITNIGPDLGITNNGNNQTITFTLNGEKGKIQSESRFTGDGKIYTMYYVGNENIEFDSTGTLRAKKPGNVNVKAYLGKEVADDKYIGEVNICVRNLAKDIELTNNNPATGEGTNASNPIYVARDEGKLTFSATFKYDGDNIPRGYDDVYWVFGEPKDGGYSDMAAQFATEAGITFDKDNDNVWMGSLSQIDENTWRGPTNTRSYTFSKNGKFMFGAIIPCNKTENASTGTIMRKDRYIEVVDPATVTVTNNTITAGLSDDEAATITITDSKSDYVSIKNPDKYADYLTVTKDDSVNSKDTSVWKLGFNDSVPDNTALRKFVANNDTVDLVITANSVVTEETIKLRTLFHNSLHYDANGGQGAPEDVSKNVLYPNTKYTHSVSDVVPVRDGYTFAGWYTEKTGGDKVGTTITVGEDSKADDQAVTLYAQWIPIDYTVRYTIAEDVTITVLPKDTDGNLIEVLMDDEKLITVTTKKVIFAKAKNMPVVEGYTFKGWYKEGSKKKLSYVPAKRFSTLANAQINAVYTENSYSVSYKMIKPKGSRVVGKVKKQPKVKYTEVFKISDSQVTATIKANPRKKLEEKVYTLAGWTTQRNGTEVEYNLGQQVSRLAGVNKKNNKIVLYPVWK